jgi:hypothetical protein
VFRRRREDEDPSVPEPVGEAGTEEPGAAAESESAGHQVQMSAGPWDAGEDVPAQERVDFGSLLVPASEGCEIQVSVMEDQAAWITVVRGESGLQLQAFAASKSGGLWDEVRREIAAELSRTGGQSHEVQGPFGMELMARIVPGEPVQGARRGALEPVRFLGVDGPRWFLRGLISGPAARHEELARPLEQVFANVVVVRGDHPVPPRDLLEIRLPEQVQQALAEQSAEPEENRWALGPFERGPEITETR